MSEIDKSLWPETCHGRWMSQEYELFKSSGGVRGILENHLMAMDPGDAVQKIDGIATREPAFGLPARICVTLTGS